MTPASFPGYAEVYQTRGQRYHGAMTACPAARRREFETMASWLLAAPESVVLDVPSGGGYLKPYLSASVRLWAVDEVISFLHAGGASHAERVLCAPHHAIPLPDASVDHISSLAGLHHCRDHPQVFQEWYRLLKAGGSLVIGDGLQDSATAAFLDGVVSRWNSEGHRGHYLSESTLRELERTGFVVEAARSVEYDWSFATVEEMLSFCRQLFGLDLLVEPGALLPGIEGTVGYHLDDTGCHLHWSLFFIRCLR